MKARVRPTLPKGKAVVEPRPRAVRAGRPALEEPLPEPLDPAPLFFWGRLFVALVWGCSWLLLVMRR